MANKQYAQEWLELAKHNLEAAELLYDSEHYTDVIAIELHQAVEKTIKAVYAYNNIKIVKTHNLIRLAKNCDLSKIVQTDYNLMEIASDYYTENRYPGTTYQMPERDELENILNFARNLYEKVNTYISDA